MSKDEFQGWSAATKKRIDFAHRTLTKTKGEEGGGSFPTVAVSNLRDFGGWWEGQTMGGTCRGTNVPAFFCYPTWNRGCDGRIQLETIKM